FSISARVMLAFPVASNWMVKGAAQFATGATLSSTVTTALQELIFPFSSVTVSTTLFAPTLLQSKVEISMERSAIPQASEDPPSTSAAVIVAFPAASSCTVMFWHTATGAMLSSTKILEVQDELFPFTSVTVKVTVFGPTSAQVKVSGLTEILAIPQLSVLPPSIKAGSKTAWPLASNSSVITLALHT